MPASTFKKNLQYYKFCTYGFLKNLRFFEPFLVLFFLEKGMSFLQIGTLYAIREMATNLLEIPMGFFADAMGRRRTMVLSFLSYIASFILFYFFSVYIIFIVAMVFFAIGEALRSGTHKAMIFDYLKSKGWQDQKVHYYGHTRSWSQFGSAISSLIAAGIVVFSGDFQTVFIFSTIPYVLDLCLMISYPKYLDGEIKQLDKANLISRFKELLRAFWRSFKHPLTLKIVNNLSLHSGFHKGIKDFLQPVLQAFALSLPIFLHYQEQQRSALVIGVAYFFIFLLTSFSSRHAGTVTSFYKNLTTPLNLSLWVGLLAGALAGFFYHFGFLVLSIFLYIMVYLIESLRKPIGISHFADRVDSDILATALSAQSQVKSLWGAIIVFSLGALIDMLGIGWGLGIVSVVLLGLSRFFRLESVKK